MEHIGIDVHKKESQICILGEDGQLVAERRIRTEGERFGAVLGGKTKARVLIEASTESEWVARCIEALGHEVIVADPNFAAMYATRSKRVKTDRRDARTLAEACRLGAYRRAHRTSEEQRRVRDALVQTRTRYISVVRALLRREGIGNFGVEHSNDGKRLYCTLKHLRDGIWSHHGQQTALLEIELSLLEFAVSITRSVHAIEVSVVRDRISRSVS